MTRRPLGSGENRAAQELNRIQYDGLHEGMLAAKCRCQPSAWWNALRPTLSILDSLSRKLVYIGAANQGSPSADKGIATMPPHRCVHQSGMASLFRSLPLLREAAPRLSKRFFSCQAPKPLAGKPRLYTTRYTSHESSSPLLQTIRARAARRQLSSVSAGADVSSAGSSPLASLAQEAREESGKKSFFPETSSKSVAWWLLASAASVYGIVVWGGLTRLTESGLSITEWRPVTGSMPPGSAEEWESEFAKYKASPEFQLLNPRMDMDEFKKIYFMEWSHRLWGRAVGLTFVLPAIYLVARRKVSKKMTLRIAGIAGLIGFQGIIGWWMVKSGLKDDLFAAGSHPRVSQYRLTAHLGTAFICYTAMLWSGLSILRENKALQKPAEAMARMKLLQSPALKPFKRYVYALAGLVFVTAMSGGLVAGLDAGLIYNEFPYMGAGLTPPKAELWSDFYCKRADKSDLWWRNMLENPSLVQLDHRILATTTFTAIMALFAYSRVPTMKKVLPRNLSRGMHGLVGFAWLQVALGLTTLLYLVPIHAASAHQAGALALLSMATIVAGRAHVSKRTFGIIGKRLSGANAVRAQAPKPLVS